MAVSAAHSGVTCMGVSGRGSTTEPRMNRWIRICTTGPGAGLATAGVVVAPNEHRLGGKSVCPSPPTPTPTVPPAPGSATVPAPVLVVPPNPFAPGVPDDDSFVT